MPIGKLDINLLSPAAKKLAKELDAAGYGMIADRTKGPGNTVLPMPTAALQRRLQKHMAELADWICGNGRVTAGT